MAVFYFAGHGMEVSGDNYLIPVDAELNSQTDVQYNALNVNQVLGNMDEKRVGMKLLILDACRDNPFKRSWSRGSDVKGLAQMAAPQGTFIAFAAAPGATAADGGTYNLRNGVFTHFLKQEIVKEGMSIDNIFTYVSRDVSNLTNNQQAPFRNSSLTAVFYFKPTLSDRPVEAFKKYYYYVDQNGKKSQTEFDDLQTAENEMKNRNLYGKIYSNAGESFVVDKPVEPEKPAEKPAEKLAEAPPTTGTPSGNRFADFTETARNLKIEMIAVQGGTFTMGCASEQGSDCRDNEQPAHQVTVSDFYIGKYEVTQAQWKAVMGSNPSKFKGDNFPVEQVSWNDVQAFINRLNEQTGKQYRLPTEAEWEFAARGGSNSRNYKYSGGHTIGAIAWYTDNSGIATHAVGTKSPNELGIYDMSGNVYEWCGDWYGDYSSAAQRDPEGPSSGSYRVIRGGSWGRDARSCRVSHRGSDYPGYRGNIVGFRVALSL